MKTIPKRLVKKPIFEEVVEHLGIDKTELAINVDPHTPAQSVLMWCLLFHSKASFDKFIVLRTFGNLEIARYILRHYRAQKGRAMSLGHVSGSNFHNRAKSTRSLPNNNFIPKKYSSAWMKRKICTWAWLKACYSNLRGLG